MLCGDKVHRYAASRVSRGVTSVNASHLKHGMQLAAPGGENAAYRILSALVAHNS